MLGEMSRRLISSPNRIRKKKIFAVGRKMGIAFRHGRRGRKLKILHLDEQLIPIYHKGTMMMTFIWIHHFNLQVHLLLHLRRHLHRHPDLPGGCQELLLKDILWDT